MRWDYRLRRIVVGLVSWHICASLGVVDEHRQALSAGTREAFEARRDRILEWWLRQLRDGEEDAEFLADLCKDDAYKYIATLRDVFERRIVMAVTEDNITVAPLQRINAQVYFVAILFRDDTIVPGVIDLSCLSSSDDEDSSMESLDTCDSPNVAVKLEIVPGVIDLSCLSSSDDEDFLMESLDTCDSPNVAVKLESVDMIRRSCKGRHANFFRDDYKYTVRSIVDVKMVFGSDCVGVVAPHYLYIPMFRVRWHDPYTAEDDTWEPVDDLVDLQVFAAFMRSDIWVAFVKENADAVKGWERIRFATQPVSALAHVRRFTITNAFERAMTYGRMTYDRIDVALQLLDLTVPGSFNYDALLTQSVIGGHTDLVRAIVQTPRFAAGTIPNSGDSELLIEAAENGHTEIVRLLLEAPVNPAHANCQDCQRGLALVEAAEGGHMEVARLLLSAPIHPARADCLDGLALEAAARGGHIEVAKLLIGYPEHAARADCKRGRVLVEAAEGGHIETKQLGVVTLRWPSFLIGYPDHPAHADCQRGRALASAAGEGHIDTVRLLMEAPAHPARADYHMGGALLRAAYGGHTEVVRLLLSAPVHPARADDQMDALLRAAEGGHTQVSIENANKVQQLLMYILNSLHQMGYRRYNGDEEDEVEVVEDAVDVVENEVERALEVDLTHDDEDEGAADESDDEAQAMSESESDDEAQAMSESDAESESESDAQAQAMSESDDESEPEAVYQPSHTFEDVAGLLERTGILETWMDKLSQNLNGALNDVHHVIPSTTINIMGSVPYHGIPTEVWLHIASLTVDRSGSSTPFPWELSRSMQKAASETTGYMRHLLVTRFRSMRNAVRAMQSMGNMKCILALVQDNSDVSLKVARSCMLSETRAAIHSDGSIEALRCMQEYWKDVINDNLVIECMGLAIRRNRPDIVRSFLITGGPVRLRRNLFDDPFMIACKFGYAEVVQILLDVNAIDRTGYADDHYDKAFAHGHITIMHMLFERGLTSFDACTMANMAFSVLFRDKPFEIRQDEEGIMRAAAHVVSVCNCNVCMSTKNLQSQMHALARHLM
eukprot:gene8876-biopygen2777